MVYETLALRNSVYAVTLGEILPVEAGVMLTLAVSRAAWVMLTFRTSVYAVTLGVMLSVEASVS